MMKIPKSIQAKLISIEMAQRKTGKLTKEVQQWLNKQCGQREVTDEGDGWTWEMHVNRQGDFMDHKQTADLLKEYEDKSKFRIEGDEE